MRDIGLDSTAHTLDLDAVKASFLVPPEVDRLTFRDLQERRRTILSRMGEERSGSRSPGRRRRGRDSRFRRS